MKYLGGKHQIAGWIAEQVLARTNCRERYVEPFVGSGAVWVRLAPQFLEAAGSDVFPDLVDYLNAIRDGWEAPRRVTEEMYCALRSAREGSPLRTHVGFNCAWSGLWFRGYGGWGGRDAEGKRVAARDGRRLRRCPPVQRLDYRDLDVRAGCVVYCDPPYADTEPYVWCGAFDSYEFWGRAIGWVRGGATVFVSEESAPQNWVEVTRMTRKANVAYSTREGRLDRDRTERLYMHESQVDDRTTMSLHRRMVEDGRRAWPAIE